MTTALISYVTLASNQGNPSEVGDHGFGLSIGSPIGAALRSTMMESIPDLDDSDNTPCSIAYHLDPVIWHLLRVNLGDRDLAIASPAISGHLR
jgi:hypothetical protein